ncbi:hypothetical protein BOX15_Mlig012459g2, partial [Macrostomum lignano]
GTEARASDRLIQIDSKVFQTAWLSQDRDSEGSSTNGSMTSSNRSDASLLTDRYPLPMHLYDGFIPNVMRFDRVVTPIWYVLGLFGNTLSAIVWLSPEVRRNNSSAVYLAALSLWDLAFLLLHTFQELKEAWNISTQNTFTCSCLPVLLLTAQYLSPLLVLGFTVERWVSVCFPFRRELLCTPRRACSVVGAMTVGVVLWNLWQLYFKTGCEVAEERYGWTAYTVGTEVVISGLVPAAALVFNLMVLREIRRINSASAARKFGAAAPSVADNGGGAGQCGNASRDAGGGGAGGNTERKFRTTTVTLLCVSFFVILTTLPAGMVYGLQSYANFGSINMTDEEVLADPVWQRHFAMTRVKKVIDEVSLSHYSLNFLIYLATGMQFRLRVADIFRRIRRISRCCRSADELSGQRRRSRTSWSATMEERRLSSVSNRRSRRATMAAAEAANDELAKSRRARSQRRAGGSDSGGDEPGQSETGGADGAEAAEALVASKV